jgi:hypothetical protein
VSSTAAFKFHAEYSISDATFQRTGPVTLRFLVNDKMLAEQRHDKTGNFTFDKPIPEQLLKANSENDLAIEVDKVFIAEADGAKLGFILSAIGLSR